METPSEAMLRRLKNLRKFKGWTDEQIILYMQTKPPKEPKPEPTIKSTETIPEVSDYDKEFKQKLRILQKEYSVDMNDANDAESLKSLVRFMLQLEVIDKSIREFYESKSTNTKTLKDFGDYQRTLQMSISDLQDKLGISRKVRKEKNVDDIPKYIEKLQDNAWDLWNRKTIAIKCEKDKIELARLWMNFPKLQNEASFELECWKCHTKVIFNL